MSDMHNTKYFMSKNHDTGKARTIFRGLSRSSSRSSIRGSAQRKLPTLLQVLRRARKMTKELEITLPSDKDWRLKNYFKLLERQRQKKTTPEVSKPKRMPSEEPDSDPNWDPVMLAQPESKRAKMSGSSSISSEGSIPVSQGTDIVWNSLDIAKAGNLLGPGAADVVFHDEDEMRRVFTLLYDVFRYKFILNEALVETGFLQKHPKYHDQTSLVWLLFYDLHKRRFLPREHADAAICRDAFDKIGLLTVEEDLWNSRVKLAASLARHRIKNNALRLNQLLPFHLRDEKLVSIEDTPVTGWINTFKTSKKEVCENIENMGLKLQSKHETVLTKQDFRFDHLCPKLLLCHPFQRADLAQSMLVKKHHIVLQDRAFCLGPAMMGKVLTDVPLRGIVAQTHVNSPRTTAYLANILSENERIEKVVAFGAGERLLEYQTYLHELGVFNCEIYAQKFPEIHPEAAILENLVAVLATPPNSYTGVTDPVDLICSRGGDMRMLQALTQTDMGEDALGFLEEQKETLKFCMSLPQVQLVLYETHSVAPEENYGMVSGVIEAMNDWARDKHAEEHRIIQEHEEAEERMNKQFTLPGAPAVREQREREALEAQETYALNREYEIPPCDLFEVAVLPELCPHGGDCLEDEGCYISRIQRKEIISLDAKYMIKIAEARGLFGAELGQKKSSTARAQKKREDMAQQRSSSGSAKIKTRKVKLEIERITAPTQASLHRHRKDDGTCTPEPPCPRLQSHTADSLNKVIQARRQMIRQWWREACKMILRLIPYADMTPRTRAAVGVPVLRLPRGKRRKPFPVHNAYIEFESQSDSGVLDRIIESLPELRRNSC